MIGYILISVLYCATFIAFMNTRDKDDKRYFDYGDWNIQYVILCIVGTALWPLVIPFIIFYRIVFKILNKQNKN